MPQAFAEDRQRIIGMPHQCQHANELRAALGLRHVFEGVEQFGVVRRIALAVGITCRVDARCTAEEIHRQTGIVGQRRQPRDTRGIARFEDRVLDERQAGFLRFDLAPFADERSCTESPSMAWSSLSLPALWLASTSCVRFIIRRGKVLG